MRKQTLKDSPRGIAGVGESGADGYEDGGGRVLGLADGGNGSQHAEGETGVEGLDGLGEEVEVVDYDYGDLLANHGGLRWWWWWCTYCAR